MTTDTLLTFPCDFTIKLFGLANNEFEADALGIIHKHVSNAADREIQAKLSANGKYCALSVTIHLESKDQLDQIYRDLSSSPKILMAL